MNIKTRGDEVKRGEKRGKCRKKRGRREVSANKKTCTSLVSTEVAYIAGRQGGGEG